MVACTGEGYDEDPRPREHQQGGTGEMLGDSRYLQSLQRMAETSAEEHGYVENLDPVQRVYRDRPTLRWGHDHLTYH